MDYVIPEYIHECVRSLPPLPAAVQQLLSLARKPDVDFRRIGKIIQSDPTLTARTLRTANSAFYGAARRIQTVRQATVLLGRDAIINLAISFSALSVEDSLKKKWPLDPAAFWRHGIAVALAARALAKMLRFKDSEEAFVAGLLHDIGKLILLNHHDTLYPELLKRAQEGARPLHKLERDLLDTDHVVAGHALCLHWNIPDSLTRAVGEHHDDTFPAANSIRGVVHNANTIIKVLQLGDGGNPYVKLCPPEYLPHTHVPPRQLRKLVRELPHAVEQAEQAFGQGNGKRPSSKRDPVQHPIVHVQVGAPDEREVLRMLLWAMGYEPIFLHEQPVAVGEDGNTAFLAGYITDRAQDPTRQLAYAQQDVPVLDYAEWRSTHSQPTDGHINVVQLRRWLSDELLCSAVRSSDV